MEGHAPLPGGGRARGEENVARLSRALWANLPLLEAVRRLGLRDETIRRFDLGMKEPYRARATSLLVERALAFPVPLPDGRYASRWAYLNAPGVTTNPVHPVGWGPGEARSYFSAPVRSGGTLMVVADVIEVWLVAQALGKRSSTVVLASSQPGAVPPEWSDRAFWRDWEDIVVGDPALASLVASASARELRLASPPRGGWSGAVADGASSAEIADLIARAEVWRSDEVNGAADVGARLAGDFPVEAVDVNGAYVGGRMYVPVTVERRSFEDRGAEGTVMLQEYVTRVLRSDGELLDVVALPCPRGTSADRRVLALTDGTRVTGVPHASRVCSWSFASVRRYVAAMQEGRPPECRALERIVADVEICLRSAVVLPDQDDYALVTAFVAASFVSRVFEALPILLVNGPRATGKSELGSAISKLSCNGLVAGRITAAGVVRLLAEVRGTLILDDLESVGRSRAGNDEICQVLKVSYKQSTARKVSAGRDGRIEHLDFFSPKVITNIAGCDPVLLSRTIAVRTAAIPLGAVLTDASTIDWNALRDELHTWAMCHVEEVATAYGFFSAAARSRADEIAAPLRAIAAVVGGGGYVRRVDSALEKDGSAPAERLEDLLYRIVADLARRGVKRLAMPRLLLELALRGSLSRMPAAETLGRKLIEIGVRSERDVVERRRLHGEVTRIYAFAPSFLENVQGADAAIRDEGRPDEDPFSFCLARPCDDCPYADVCGVILPDLGRRKRARG